MFGDMFEEPDPSVQGCLPKSLNDSNTKVEAPPPIRGETGFCGIKNQGATCYLNSLIQTLLLTPEFREELFKIGPDELGKLEDVKKKNAKVRVIPIQIQMLLARLLLLKQNACGTEGLTESFGWVDNEELQQHDVQELSRILFCAIEDSLVGTSGHSIIKNLYRGVIANTTTCLNCRKVSERPEEFLDLTIAIAAQSSLTEVLNDMFVETELMNGKNQYHCDNCAKLVDAQKGAVIKTLPPILTVSLLRFSFDYSTLRRFKETRKLEFPLVLKMRKFCEKSDDSKQCYTYDLYSVIIHSGSAHGGHYHAYIRDIDGLGNVPPDYDPTPPKPAAPSPSKLMTTDEYIEDPLELVAAVLGKLGGENVPLNKLGEAFREESGTSWARQYKKKYGTMTKFLQGHKETFVVESRSKNVSFRTMNKDSTILSGNSPLTETYSSCGDGFSSTDDANLCWSQQDFDHGDCSTLNSDPENDPDLDNDYHPLCNVWFDFNDSNVKTITTHDIEMQYEGRESAYMLFYRRRDLKRPLVSLGNALNDIPGHILAQIQEENVNLQHLRDEYDVYLNVVTVRVYFPGMFKKDNGLLKLIEGDLSESGFPYSIDRRKTISNMRSEFLQMAEKNGGITLEGNKESLQCNVLKFLEHDGIHLYEQVDCEKDMVIDDSSLKNDQKLIMWDGSEISGAKIIPGEGNEAILLNVNCEIQGEVEISCFDYKGVAHGSTSVQDLKQYFLEKLKMRHVESSAIGIITDSGQFDEIKNLDKSLCDVMKSCCGNVLVKVRVLEDAGAGDLKNEDVFTLSISLDKSLESELQDNGAFSKDDKVFMVTSVSCIVKVSSFLFVEHLKSKIPRWLYPQQQNIISLDRLFLYLDNSNSLGSLTVSKLSLHEQQSLTNAGLSNSFSVMLALGLPLDRSTIHVSVYVQKGNKLKLPVKKCNSLKLACVKTRSVADFIEKIVQELNLPQDDYHLKILKSEREVGDVVSHPDRPVERTAISHGCAVILCPGNVPSEGQMRVPILYYPNMDSFDDLRIKLRDNPTLSPWCSFMDEKLIEPIPIGNIEVEKDATIFDIKQKIVNLDYFENTTVKKYEDICIRSIVNKLPTKFHIQDNATIKRLRLGPNNPVAVQLASNYPPDGYASVHLSFNVTGTRLYSNACELQWEKAASLAQFPGKLADIFNLPPKEILLARRGEEPWDWEVIKTREIDPKAKNNKTVTKGKKNSKQKKTQTKSKVKKSSIKIATSAQDGDVLRVKRIVQDPGAPDVTDFRSDEDVIAYKRWQDSHQKESISPPKEDSKQNEAEKKTKPKKEESLRIHVDKF